MTITTTDRAVVRQMTDAEMREAIGELLSRVRMSREDLGQRGATYQLDAEERSVLADIEALEWMLGRA